VMANTEILKEYHTYLQQNKKSKNTVISYFSNVQRFIDFVDVDISEISDAHVQKYFEEKKSLSPASKQIIKSAIYDFSRFTGIELSKIQGLPAVRRAVSLIPSESDFKKILFYASQKPGFEGLRNKTILSLMYHTGLRIEETQVLDLDYIDLDERNVYVVGKGSKRRVIPINDTLHDILCAYIDARLSIKTPTNALFLSYGKNHRFAPFSYGGFRQAIKNCFVVAGYGHLEPYSLRHAFCTRLIKSGIDLTLAASLMGHSDVATIFHYYVPDNLDGREAVRALNF